MTEPLTPTPTPWFCENDGIYNAARSYLITPTGDSDQDRADAAHIVAAVNEIHSLGLPVYGLRKNGTSGRRSQSLVRESLWYERHSVYPSTAQDRHRGRGRPGSLVTSGDRAEAAEERALRAEEERDEARARAADTCANTTTSRWDGATLSNRLRPPRTV